MHRVVLFSVMFGAIAQTPMEDLLPSSCKLSTAPETCFGAQGKKCDKLPPGIDNCPSGQQAVSAGSLAHDTCCLECFNEGIACSEEAPTPASLESLNNSAPCALEWRKAGWNGLDGRYWCVNFDNDKISDVRVIAGTRKFDTSEFGGTLYKSLLLHNRASTSVLCAPGGTDMDCIGCESCTGNCAKGMGDSGICCSGYFKKVQVWGVSSFSKTFGTCADASQSDTLVV